MATKKDFGTSMLRLEEIVSTLDDGQASLEEALALFEEGAKLMKECNKILKDAEVKVAKLVPSASGEPLEKEMED